MQNLFIIILITFIYIFAGYPLSGILTPLYRFERFALSFLLGLGLVTFTWFTLYLLGIPFTIISFIISNVIVWILGKFTTNLSGLSKELTLPKFTLTQKYLAIALVIVLLSNFVIAQYFPVTAWDSLALYDFRGKVIAHSGGFADLLQDSYYVSYPLLTSLMHASVYMAGGLNPQGLYSLIFTAFILIIFGRLLKTTNIRFAFLAAFALTFASELFSHATFAYTNLPYTVYLILSIVILINISKISSNTEYYLTGLLLGISFWTRSAEPYWIVICIAIIAISWKHRQFKSGIISLVIFLIPKLTWGQFHNSVLSRLSIVDQALPSIMSLSTYIQIWHNIPQLVKYINIYVIEPYLGYWLLLLPMIIIAKLTKNHLVQRGILLFIALIVVTISGIMLFSVYYATWDGIGDSARRMLLFVIPLQIILGTYTLFGVLETKNGK